MTLTQPTKSSRDWEKLHKGHLEHFRSLAKSRGVKVRKAIHSPAFEAGARAKLAGAK